LTVNIKTYPHPALKRVCKPVVRINQELRDIAAEMFRLMYEAAGVGLAANQVGLPIQLLVMNPAYDPKNPIENKEEYAFINPVIIKRLGNIEEEEGCLSFPEIRATVNRSAEIIFEAITLDGETVQYHWKDFSARVFQHEMDHLRGVAFVERLSDTVKWGVQENLNDLATVFNADQSRGFIPSDSDLSNEFEEIERKFCEG